jgi:hypothetical protein
MNTSRKSSPSRRRARRSGMLFMMGGICLWLAAIGLMHVITSNNIHALGDQQRLLERQIEELRRDIRNTDLQITAATTETALRERLSEKSGTSPSRPTSRRSPPFRSIAISRLRNDFTHRKRPRHQQAHPAPHCRCGHCLAGRLWRGGLAAL